MVTLLIETKIMSDTYQTRLLSDSTGVALTGVQISRGIDRATIESKVCPTKSPERFYWCSLNMRRQSALSIDMVIAGMMS